MSSSLLLSFSLLPEMPIQLKFSPLPARTPVTLVPPGPLCSPPNTTKCFPSSPKSSNLTIPLRPPKNCKLVSSYSPPLQITARNRIHPPLNGSTRAIATLVAIALSLSKHLASKISLLLSLKFRPPLPNPINTLAIEARPLFFAAISHSSSAFMSMGTPIAVIAAGLARWLEIYSCVLLIRVLLSWFPNIPWDKQPFSAIRDLCDPYLSLFRAVIPPLFNSLDVSPILAFLLLGMLGQLARPPR
ncbi:hypothetical protein Vadar_023377 [Vaccinium darrowii]|uniref:Uncharacterized protein n=1 Tax=Vaccinium darrowii TaxID=229202 RepID=A0ACB7XC62_9ERIC|nr:hypothetical protein Vadar_023377 [Vaccinium darrowii]